MQLSDRQRENASTEGVRVVRADSPEAAQLVGQTETWYAKLKRESPDVWAELYGSPDAPGPYPQT